MLEMLKDLAKEEYDAYFFLPGPKEDSMYLEGSNYVTPGEKIDGSLHGLGDAYHILLFKEDEDGMVCKADLFDGILGAPLEYISIMIKMDWFGLVCRKTTTSHTFVQSTFDKITND